MRWCPNFSDGRRKSSTTIIFNMDTVLKVNNLTKVFHNALDKALDDVSFDLKYGEVLSIIGPSGSGKSTLMRCCTQLEKPSSGEIEVCGIKLYQNKNDDRAALLKTSLVFQNFNLFPHCSVLQNITLPQIKVLKKSKEEAEENAKELLERMGLSDKKDSYPCFLSGGQQQRVCIARAIVNEPKLLVCDEPTGNLDPMTSKEIMDVISNINNDLGTTVIMATHDKEIVNRMKKRVLVINNGMLVGDYKKGSYKSESD